MMMMMMMIVKLRLTAPHLQSQRHQPPLLSPAKGDIQFLMLWGSKDGMGYLVHEDSQLILGTGHKSDMIVVILS